jgi:YidC/Oxa1 family membrane protein insertase
MYLVFRSPVIGGARNVLLGHDLFGAALGSHWLGGVGPLSAQGAVFAGLLALLAAVGWLTARLTRRLAAARPPAGQPGDMPAAGAAVSAWLARLAPYVTVVVAALVPLATGVYLLTTTAWTLGERALLGRRAHHP